MNKKTSSLRRNTAVLAAATVLGGLSIGGMMSAQAATPSDPAAPGTSQIQVSDGDGELNPATEAAQGNGKADAETNDDANGKDDADTRDGAEEADETADGPDKGPDANPNEPGHQDADESGETA